MDIEKLIEDMKTLASNGGNKLEMRNLIDDLEKEIETIQNRDLDWYITEHPDELLEVGIPEDTSLGLWRAGVIDLGSAESLTVGSLCELLDT